MRKGFTLVELSIVLVIIGLLIGGILVAQSMVSTAKIGRVIRDLGSYDVAMANFKTKFNQWPGDTVHFPIADGSANNNGVIELQNYDVGSEAAAVWNHLSLGVSLMNEQNKPYVIYDFFTDSAAQDAPVLPFPSVNKVTYPPKLNFSNNSWSFTSVQPGGMGSMTEDDAVKPVDLLAVDTKLDDGLSNSGKVTGYSARRSHHPSHPDCRSGNNYNISSDTFSCTPSFKIGISNGIF